MLTVPGPPKALTMLTLGFGIFAFVWLSAEDSVWLVSVLGTILAILCTLHAIFRLKGKIFSARIWIPGVLGVTALTGAGASVATVLFMVIKTSLHGHIYPDYPFPLIAGIVERMPAWTLAGALIGVALALIIPLRQKGP
jgi:hypothetical protein